MIALLQREALVVGPNNVASVVTDEAEGTITMSVPDGWTATEFGRDTYRWLSQPQHLPGVAGAQP